MSWVMNLYELFIVIVMVYVYHLLLCCNDVNILD